MAPEACSSSGWRPTPAQEARDRQFALQLQTDDEEMQLPYDRKGKVWKGGNEDWDKILSKWTVCRVIKIVWKRDEADFKNLKKKN